jgi:uncharacterized RDD family membrane protein YckC
LHDNSNPGTGKPNGGGALPAALTVLRAAAYGTDAILLLAILVPITFLLQPLLQADPQSGRAMWNAAVLCYSIPTWIYFVLGDRSLTGATPGKRLWGIHVHSLRGRSVSLSDAISRTAIKLLPVELTRLVFLFADSTDADQQANTFVVTLANLLAFIYLAVCAHTRGQRSVHDLVAGTAVKALKRV